MIRFGIIGVGMIGSAHAKALYEGKVTHGVLAAVCDISPERRAWVNETMPEVKLYENADAFFEQADVDAVILSVPHYYHPIYACRAFDRGLHVLTEKPAGVTVDTVRVMNSMAEKSGKRFGIMFNQRTNPLYARVRELVANGTIGQPQRLLWQATAWYRTQEYYDSGSWRATWAGEGGGVLMNQAPHQMDLLQWIFGLPDFVYSHCETGKYHRIEVEDDAVIFGRYKDGRTMSFYASTGENPGTNRLEICGTNGKLTAVPHRLELTLLKDGKPERTVEEFPERESGHVGILNDFADGIEENRPFLAEGREGINEVLLNNAAYYSSWLNAEVPLPFDEADYVRRHKELREKSVVKGAAAIVTDGEYKSKWFA